VWRFISQGIPTSFAKSGSVKWARNHCLIVSGGRKFDCDRKRAWRNVVRSWVLEKAPPALNIMSDGFVFGERKGRNTGS
jgi:hypothetical protein